MVRGNFLPVSSLLQRDNFLRLFELTVSRILLFLSYMADMYQITGNALSVKRKLGYASLHRNKPLISPLSTFTVDFKGLQHPLCPRALRVQKKTSEFYINRRADLGNLNLYPHHELHAEDHNKVHFKLH